MTPSAVAPPDWERIRSDFPVLRREIDGRPIVYLDSANTSQKPEVVIEAMASFMREGYAPINRSAYRLAAAATDAFEGARAKVARFINAARPEEVVFTRNATEALNMVAQSWGRANLRAGDAVVLTHMEHHANIVPWQMLVDQIGIELRFIPLTDDGLLDLDGLPTLLDGARVLSVTAMSNVLGTINPVERLVAAGRDAGCMVMIDACQSVPHGITDVQAWGADFVAFSGHKMLGPSGIGVLWGSSEQLELLPPFLGGGNMIDDVRLDGFTCAPVPAKFEAGTPAIVEAVGLGAAVDYLEAIGMANVRQHEMSLTRYAIDSLRARYGDDIVIHGTDNVEQRGGVLSIAFRDIHPHDLSQVLDESNICVRAGHHCAKPLMRLLGANATVRASMYVYNDRSDVDALVEGLDGASDIFGF
ncbi:MAG: aminotransferase class V-fold PLP-dependent enzyme [Ilumatobacteraceae bacterium]